MLIVMDQSKYGDIHMQSQYFGARSPWTMQSAQGDTMHDILSQVNNNKNISQGFI